MIIGIDFGTTNSCISIFNPETNKIDVIPDTAGNLTYPTCIFFNKDTDDILVGEIAFNLLRSKNNKIYIGNIIHDIKRLVGVKWDEFENNINLQKFFNKSGIIIVNNEGFCGIKIKYNNQEQIFTVNKIINIYLNYLKFLIKNWLNIREDTCLDIVITVPAYFTDIQRDIIAKCCDSCNLNVIRMINEPTAAILAYIWEQYNNDKSFLDINKKPDDYLVIDCGGGTTDLSLVNVDYEEMIFQVKTVEGDNFLGGVDVTNKLVEWICNKMELNNHQLIDTGIINRIIKECERLKNDISYSENATFTLESVFDKDYKIPISRTRFIEINSEFFNKISSLLKTIRYSHLPDKILFVGGSTNIPYFSTLCKKIFGDKIEIINNLDKNKGVSIGATVQGVILKDLLIDSHNRFKDTLLIDIIPMSIGVKTIGDIMSIIIPKNTHIPCEKIQFFTNSHDFVDAIDIDLYQGNRKFIKDNYHIGSFTLEDLDITKKRGEQKLKLVIKVDSDGIINVLAEETTTGVSRQLTISKTTTSNKNNDDDIINDELLKLDDTERLNKVLCKLELYDSFKFLLGRFHEIKNDLVKNNIDINSNWNKFQIHELNELFNDTFELIKNWENFDKDYIKNQKILFEENWHKIIYNLMTNGAN